MPVALKFATRHAGLSTILSLKRVEVSAGKGLLSVLWDVHICPPLAPLAPGGGERSANALPTTGSLDREAFDLQGVALGGVLGKEPRSETDRHRGDLGRVKSVVLGASRCRAMRILEVA